ncbi:MAG: carbohydrate kinase [Kiritimatiellae bacterium]|nr:carbohydrate kinase [Kiritimatiellia bacterium]
MTTLDARRAAEIVARFHDQRILVVGDVMLDRYIRGSVNRISPEAPVPVVAVTGETASPGGAANVARNVQSLGGVTVLCGVVGEDAAGRELMEVLGRDDINAGGVRRFPDVQTTVKTRVVAGRQQIVRVDWDVPLDLSERQVDLLCRHVADLTRESSGVVIEDYGKGCVRQEIVDAVLSVARQRRVPVGFDPKENHWLKISGVSVATPNLREAYAGAGLPERPLAADALKDVALRKAAGILLQKWRPDLLIVTLGPQGMLLLSQNEPPAAIPTRAREVYDVSGAGDTVIAACVLALAAGASHYEAAGLANYAAGVVVGKAGTASCSQEELLAGFQQTP